MDNKKNITPIVQVHLDTCVGGRPQHLETPPLHLDLKVEKDSGCSMPATLQVIFVMKRIEVGPIQLNNFIMHSQN